MLWAVFDNHVRHLSNQGKNCNSKSHGLLQISKRAAQKLNINSLNFKNNPKDITIRQCKKYLKNPKKKTTYQKRTNMPRIRTKKKHYDLI